MQRGLLKVLGCTALSDAASEGILSIFVVYSTSNFDHSSLEALPFDLSHLTPTGDNVRGFYRQWQEAAMIGMNSTDQALRNLVAVTKIGFHLWTSSFLLFPPLRALHATRLKLAVLKHHLVVIRSLATCFDATQSHQRSSLASFVSSKASFIEHSLLSRKSCPLLAQFLASTPNKWNKRAWRNQSRATCQLKRTLYVLSIWSRINCGVT